MKKPFIFLTKLRLHLKSEKGFILPLSLSFLFLFSIIVMYAAQQFESEKRYYHSLKIANETETLFYIGIKDFIREVEKDETEISTQLEYDVGTVHVQIVQNSEEVLLFQIRISHNKGGSMAGEVLYNRLSKRIERITEIFN